MKKLIERVKDLFKKDKLPQKVSDHLEYTRDVYAFIKQDTDGNSYIPIPKEIYDEGSDMVIDWNNSIIKTIDMHSYLSYMNFKENLEGRGYNIMLNDNEMKDTLMKGNDYILN
jgi:hypothetical protein